MSKSITRHALQAKLDLMRTVSAHCEWRRVVIVESV